MKGKRSKVARYYFAEAQDYAGVVEAEAVFFEALICKKDELRNHYSVHQAMKAANYFLGDPKGRPLDVLVEFCVNDPRTQATQRIYLGTKLYPGDGRSQPEVTHFFCLGDGSNLLTKVHHDRDFNNNASEKKPLTHIQMGGRVSPSLAAKAAAFYSAVDRTEKQDQQDRILGSSTASRACCWRDDVDKPRIPSMPVCTALLWHLAFLEYPRAEQVKPILDATWWHRIVVKAEESILKPFFDDGSNLMHYKPQTGLLNALYEPVLR